MKSSQFKFWSTLSISALLVACGGGGGSGGSASSTETFQLRTAYVSYTNSTGSWPFTVTGSTSGVNVTGSGTTTAGSISGTTFEGQAAQAKTTTITGTINANGRSVPLATTGTSYVSSNYDLLGNSSATSYEVVSSSIPIPATARINDTGTWYSSTRYTDQSKTTRRGTATATFVLEPDTASTALLKIIRIEKDTANTVTSTSTIAFRITPAGALTRLSETNVQGTATLTTTY